MSVTTTAAAAVGRPRSQASHDAIITACLKLFREKPYGEVSIEAIATEAGVGKATIYRWWPNKLALAIDVLMEQLHLPEFQYSGKNIRRHLLKGLKACHENMLQGDLAQVISGVVADCQRDEKLREQFYEGFFAKLREIGMRDLAHAMALGQLSDKLDRDVFLDQLFGCLYYRVLIANKPVDDKYLQTLIDNLLPADTLPAGAI
ncbi:MAG: TetR/AcrR family transcriptional regulator [Pseudomonadales bacterium]|nr:TetR/AcrR family transcriptional regulator [Pseudomonadales bacterium]